MQPQDALRLIPELSAAAPSTLDLLSHAMVQRVRPPRAVVYREATEASHVFVIEHGFVWFTRRTHIEEPWFLGEAIAPVLCGAAEAIANRQHSATATAATHCWYWELAADVFLEAIAADPALCPGLMSQAMDQLIQRDLVLAAKAHRTAIQRVAQELVALAERRGSDRTQDISQTDLALITGLSRESVTRSLTTLKRKAVVTTRRNVVEIEDIEELRRLT